MSDYYYNAHVTLAAAFSVDCEGGLFSKQPRRECYLFKAIIRRKYCRFFAIRKSRDIGYYSDNKASVRIHQWPLATRGWAYQERLVSRRVLYFTRDQLIFDCFRGLALEEAPYYPGLHLLDDLKQSYWKLLNNTATFYDWKIIIQVYSMLHLTKPGDRLPAIAAIAQQVLSRQGPEGKLGNVYLCGLMAGALHTELLWFPGPMMTGSKQDFQRLAPSWSWASYPGRVFYEGRDSDKSQIELVKDSLEFTASGRFGACTGGYITLKASVIDCVWKVRWDKHFPHKGRLSRGQILLLDAHPSPEQRATLLMPDYAGGYQELEGLKDGDEVKVKVIQVCSDPLGALVLYQSMKTNLYRRLGVQREFIPGLARSSPYKMQTKDDLAHQFSKAQRQILSME